MTKFYARSLHLTLQLLRWWWAELAGMVPVRVRGLLECRRSQLVLVQDGEGYALLLCGRAATKPVGRLGADAPLTPATLEAAIGDVRLARRVMRGALPLVLRLPAGTALVTKLTLPVAVKADLPQILRHEMDRRTPFSANDAYFSYDVTANAAPGKMDIVLTVIARATVTEALSRFAALGVAIRQVTVAGHDMQASGNLLPVETAGTGKLRMALRLAAVAAVLATVGGLYSILQEGSETVSALRQDMARLRNIAEQVETARAEIDRLQAASAFLGNRRRGSLAATQMLSELTDVLPDDTWLVQLSVHDDKLQIAGYSAAAAGLIEKVMQSPAFRAPQFRSAVTQDASVGRERFEMVMTIAPGARP